MRQSIWTGIDVNKKTWPVRRRLAIGVSWLLVGLTGVSGCGPDDGRLAVSGSVTVDGELLDGAAINFQPTTGTSGHSSGGPVQNGIFRVATAKGLLPGTYRVTILAMKKTGRVIEDPQKGRVPELVQVRFRKLPGEVAVRADAENEFQFDLISVP